MPFLVLVPVSDTGERGGPTISEIGEEAGNVGIGAFEELDSLRGETQYDFNRLDVLHGDQPPWVEVQTLARFGSAHRRAVAMQTIVGTLVGTLGAEPCR